MNASWLRRCQDPPSSTAPPTRIPVHLCTDTQLWIEPLEAADEPVPRCGRERAPPRCDYAGLEVSSEEARLMDDNRAGADLRTQYRRHRSSPDGRGPVLVHALEGFSDAGHAIRLAAEHLTDTLDTELNSGIVRHRRSAGLPLAAADDDVQERPLHPLRRPRPQTSMRFTTASARPFLLLAGLEPDLKWERFITAVRLLAERLGVRQTIGLGAIPMAVPHTRPVSMTSAFEQSRTRRRPPALGERGPGPQRLQPARVPDGITRPTRCDFTVHVPTWPRPTSGGR